MCPPLRLFSTLAALAVLWCSPAPAHAQALPTARLVYEAVAEAKSCASEQEVRDKIAARLGYDPFSRDSARTIVVRMAPHPKQGTRFLARIELRRAASKAPPQVRTLDSPEDSCAPLLEAVLFTVSVVIDPRASMREAPKDGQLASMAAVLRVHDARFGAQLVALKAAERQRESADPVVVAPTPPPTPPVGAPAEPLELAAQLGGGAALGLAPEATVFFRMMLHLERPSWSLGLGALVTTTSRTAISPGTLETSLLAAELMPCWRRGWFRACAVGTLGALRSTGVDLEQSASNADWYAAVGAGSGVAIPLLSWLDVQLYAQLQGTVVRTRVLIDEDPVWRTPDLSALFGLALALSLL